MVKSFFGVLLLLFLAAPAFAQDVPQIELGFGYGNFAMKDLVPDRHSGLATHQTINLNSIFAIENYLGYYSFGSDPSLGDMELITELFGGKFSYRNLGPVIYGTAAIGGGFLRFPDFGSGTNAFGVKYGGGIDIPFKESFAWKLEVSRMSFHFFDQWNSGMNISAGIVIKISQ
jgi:hypothetical protein